MHEEGFSLIQRGSPISAHQLVLRHAWAAVRLEKQTYADLSTLSSAEVHYSHISTLFPRPDHHHQSSTSSLFPSLDL